MVEQEPISTQIKVSPLDADAILPVLRILEQTIRQENVPYYPEIREYIQRMYDFLEISGFNSQYFIIGTEHRVFGVMGVREIQYDDPRVQEIQKNTFPEQKRGILEIINCYLAQEERRRGVGTQLFNAVRKIFDGFSSEIVIVQSSYPDAVEFYKKMGFVEVSEYETKERYLQNDNIIGERFKKYRVLIFYNPDSSNHSAV